MSNAAKLAWAEKAGVTPPEYVVAAVASEAHDHEHPSGDTAELVADDCCSAKAGSCCSEAKHCCSKTAHNEAAAPPASGGFQLIHLMAAMKCRGLTVTVALLPPSLPVICNEFFPRAVERYQPALADSNFYDAPYLAVDSPPPRAAVA
jgi:hypothetical protein